MPVRGASRRLLLLFHGRWGSGRWVLCPRCCIPTTSACGGGGPEWEAGRGRSGSALATAGLWTSGIWGKGNGRPPPPRRKWRSGAWRRRGATGRSRRRPSRRFPSRLHGELISFLLTSGIRRCWYDFTGSRGLSKQEDFYPRCSPRNTASQSRDTPPKRDTGIASEKDWGINLLNESVNESGTNEDGSTWYQESGEVLGDNGYRCRWARMGGQSHDGSSEWTETWWEKSDWTGHKELGAEKSGKNAEGDSWWETWQEVLYQDEWRTDKWAETELGTKWGDQWEERFFAGIGSRQGETWHVSPTDGCWSRTWGEEHCGNGKVHKYGKSTTGESWDIVVDEETNYEAERHYGWADVVGNSSQLLSIQPLEGLPGVYPDLDFGPLPPPEDSPDVSSASS